jgi:hypothetical protein
MQIIVAKFFAPIGREFRNWLIHIIVKENRNMRKEYDVIVVGGGIAGSCAAIASARLGARTLIVERFGYLGGMLTAAGVGPMMTFHAGNNQVVRGIAGELIERMAARGKSPGHIFDTTGYTYTVTPFDAEAMKYDLETMFIEAGGTLLYHSVLSDAAVENGSVETVTVQAKARKITLSAKVFVDATGDADLAYISGVPCTVGRPEDGACQPMTMNLKVSGVNIARTREFIRDKENIDEFPRIKDDLRIVDRGPRLSIGGFVKTFENANKTGEVTFIRGEALFFETNNPGEVVVNMSRVSFPDPTDPWTLSLAEVEGRKQALELEKFLIRRIPGFENAVLIHSGPAQIGVRSSRQIQGLYVLTEDDLLDCAAFDDVIAHGGYPIDVHPPAGGHSQQFRESRKKLERLKWGDTYGIPYRSLLNGTVANLITVGRCISATFTAQGAIRVTPIAGATGHAGGVAAATAAEFGVNPRNVDVGELHRRLVGQNAYLQVNV